MPKAIKICRVCGKEYEACHTNRSSNGVFRWQDVACSPECGAIYLAQIRASRGVKETVKEAEEIHEDEVKEYAVDAVEEDVNQSEDKTDVKHFRRHNKKNKF